MSNADFGLLRDYLRSLESVRCGCRGRDRIAILLNRIIHASFPLNALSYRVFGRSLVDPSLIIRGYKCRYGPLVYYCPGGNSETQFLDYWEPDVKRVIGKFTRGDAIDVGANLGLYTVMLSANSADHRRILSIEADPIQYRWMLKNIQANKCSNVIPLNIAAWSKETKLRLTRHVFGGPIAYSSVSFESRYAQDVGARSIDEVLEEVKIDPKLVKIDVEGSEFEVLRGMSETLRSAKPDLVFESSNRHTRANCFSLLEGLNYGIMPLDDGNFLATSR
jgi:FkbM family methyltransferase